MGIVVLGIVGVSMKKIALRLVSVYMIEESTSYSFQVMKIKVTKMSVMLTLPIEFFTINEWAVSA